ncbi:MAG: DUF3467 domain-containing protein, partial [Pirellulaceae bacterium]|nr:DUF3467 domain-containing protein [Pirellulaceae bacterium]
MAKQTAPTPPPAAGQPIDDAGVPATYANFCRVMSNPEELILDFGLQRELANRETPIKINQRIVLSHTNAQRL